MENGLNLIKRGYLGGYVENAALYSFRGKNGTEIIVGIDICDITGQTGRMPTKR